MTDRLLLDFQSVVAGRYAVERELGRGGMGVVFLARDLKLDRVVAVKLLPPGHARDGGLRERFLREARMAARLSHPHVVPIHAVEEAGDFVFFVMAYVEGETLGARVRRDGPLDPRETARVLREVAWALAYAHAQGVIHRDVKADNILLEARTGRALVADFGIARLVQGPGVSGKGELVGTPEYMSPEQASAEAVDGRSDLYSLGVVGYYALSGRLPFTAPTVPALLLKQVREAPPPLAAAGATRSLVAAIERCLAKDPARRFESGEALADALGAALEARPELPMPVRAFLAQARSPARRHVVAPWVAAALLIPGGIMLALDIVFPGPVPDLFQRGVVAIGGVLLAVGFSSGLALRGLRVRGLLGKGYTRDDLLHGLRREIERHKEEVEFAYGSGPGRWERLLRVKSYGALALAAAGAASGFFLPYPEVQVGLAAFVLGSATALATGIAAREARRRRLEVDEERELRWWRGWRGRLFFWLGALGLGRRAVPLPADRPTEMALGLGAMDLFNALPAETRRALGDVPKVIRGLEENARRLGSAALDSGPTHEAAGHRRAEALAALEAIRLDLLRLQNGVGTLDGLTQDLDAAREIGEDVDRLLAGLRDGP